MFIKDQCWSFYNEIQYSLPFSFFVSNVPALFIWGSFPYIVISIASQPFICTFQENHLDACPIRTLLEVVERTMSCEITVHMSFSYKCGQFSWCNALIMEVVVIFPDISPFRCLHDSILFPETLLSSVGSYLKYSQGVFLRILGRQTNLPFLLGPFIHSFCLFLNDLTSSLLGLSSCVRLWLTYMLIFNHP